MGRYEKKIESTNQSMVKPKGACSCFIASCSKTCSFNCFKTSTKSISPSSLNKKQEKIAISYDMAILKLRKEIIYVKKNCYKKFY